MRNKADFSELERTRNHGDTLKSGMRRTAFHEHLGGRYESIGDDLRGSLKVRAGGELIPGLSAARDQKVRAKG